VLLAGPGLVVRELLQRVKAAVMGAVANADVPIERALQVAGLPASANVFEASCAVHDEGFFDVGDMQGFEARPRHPAAERPPGRCSMHLRCSACVCAALAPRRGAVPAAPRRPVCRPGQAERLDVYPREDVMGESLLALELSEIRGSLRGLLTYNADIFRRSTAQRIAGHLEVRRPSPRSCNTRSHTQHGAHKPTAAQVRRQAVYHEQRPRAHPLTADPARVQELLEAMAQGGLDAAVDSLPLARQMVRRLRSSATSRLGSLGAPLASGAPSGPSAWPSRALQRGRSSANRLLRSINTGELAHALRSAGPAALPPADDSLGPATASAESSGAASPGPLARRVSSMQLRSYSRAHSFRGAPPLRMGSGGGSMLPGASSSQLREPSPRMSTRRGSVSPSVARIAEEAAGQAGAVTRAGERHLGPSFAPPPAQGFSAGGADLVMPSPFTSPFEAGADGEAAAAAFGAPSPRACPSAPVDSEELLRRRTWARVVGGAARPADARGAAARRRSVAFE